MSPFEERRFYAARLRGIAVLLSTTLILLTPVAALATEVLTPLGRQGKAVLTRFCSECHAVGRTGASPNPAAPAFRTIDRRYPLESLRQTLADIGRHWRRHCSFPVLRTYRGSASPGRTFAG
jgi:mono/diheme cytochrome c family protein